MGESNGYKVISIVALIMAVVGVTLGYAAFSNTLIIESEAEVTPDSSNFNVDFSSSDSAVQTNNITPTLSANVTGFTATAATIDNTSDPTVSNIKATFTEPGQYATYSFYAYNAGQYIAYLNSIEFDGTKTCTATGTTTQSLVDSACNGITLSVKVGSENYTSTDVATISSHSLAISGSEDVIVKIEYAAGSAIADGDFEVTFPDIKLTYASAD